jgi:hypothetical protein
MRSRGRRLGWLAVGLAMVMTAVGGVASPAGAVEVGQPAPDFKLPSTTGVDISLSEFRGTKWVFLEFYGLDFQPT